MPYSITTKDGITIQNIPDDEPADSPRLKQRVTEIRSQMNPAPSDRDKLLSNPVMRFAKGMKDPIDGAAQLLRAGVEYSPLSLLTKAATGKSVADMVDSAANAVGGEGTFLGDVAGVKGATGEQLRNDIVQSNAEYDAARKATAPATLSSLVTGQRDPGLDAMRLAGNVLSPANVLAARAAPAINVAAPVRSIAARGAVSGAAGAATQPVTGDNFAAEKAGQVALGAAGGAVLTPVLAKVGDAAARVLQNYRSRGTVNVTPEGLRLQIARQLAEDGIEADQIPQHVFQQLTDDVRSALATGRKLDPAAALRERDFTALGIPALRGQVTRNPAQWQREFNLSGVEGAGEPLQQVMQAQSRGIQGRLDQGARGAMDRFNAGELLRGELQAANRTAEQNVRAAYDAFRQSTGRELDVPLQGLAQDYASALDTFGDAIPGAVRKQFEGLGLMGGKQLKSLTIEQAENLIKTINANTDPANRVASNALGRLRASVQDAIVNAADNAPSGAGAEAAALAKEARAMAAGRFQTIESTPALKAAIDGMEPDQFVQRFVIGGKVNEIERMQQLLGPEGRGQVRAQMVAYLRDKAFGANAAGDGRAAQATFNRELQRIGRPKLVAMLGADGADEMMRIGRVLAYMKQVPEGATPNTSGTGQMVTSMLGRMRGVKGLPYVNDWIVQPISKFADRREVQQALQGAPTEAAELDPKLVQALSALFAPVPVAAGSALGYSVR
jgi:hypothetical protein